MYKQIKHNDQRSHSLNRIILLVFTHISALGLQLYSFSYSFVFDYLNDYDAFCYD